MVVAQRVLAWHMDEKSKKEKMEKRRVCKLIGRVRGSIGKP